MGFVTLEEFISVLENPGVDDDVVLAMYDSIGTASVRKMRAANCLLAKCRPKAADKLLNKIRRLQSQISQYECH
jgi:hypothetical protein